MCLFKGENRETYLNYRGSTEINQLPQAQNALSGAMQSTADILLSETADFPLEGLILGTRVVVVAADVTNAGIRR